jgi:hypothetical protein
MQIYSRANDKQTRHKQKDKEDQYEEYYDDCSYGHCDYCDGPSLDDVRRGWLVNLLSKLRVRGTKEILDDLRW